MLLIWGFRTKVVTLLTFVYVCDHCRQQAVHYLVKRVRWFTFFFLPVIPYSTAYLDSCVACGRVLTVPKEQAVAAVERDQTRLAA